MAFATGRVADAASLGSCAVLAGVKLIILLGLVLQALRSNFLQYKKFWCVRKFKFNTKSFSRHFSQRNKRADFSPATFTSSILLGCLRLYSQDTYLESLLIEVLFWIFLISMSSDSPFKNRQRIIITPGPANSPRAAASVPGTSQAAFQGPNAAAGSGRKHVAPGKPGPAAGGDSKLVEQGKSLFGTLDSEHQSHY